MKAVLNTKPTSVYEDDRVLQQVQAAVHGWRSEASRLHIPHAEQDLMASAFEP